MNLIVALVGMKQYLGNLNKKFIMNPKEKELIKQEIRNLEELVRQNVGSSEIPKWKQEIANLRSRLTF